MSTTTIPLDPQPPQGVEVELLSGNDERYAYHAMTVGQGYDSEFYACPAGVPLDVRREGNAWVWVTPGGGTGGSTGAA